MSRCRIHRHVTKTLPRVALVAALMLAGARASHAAAVPTFGGVTLFTNRLDLLTAEGGASFQILGNAVAWPVLMPNGRDFDANAIKSLDQQMRAATAGGIRQIVVRVKPGGGPIAPFAGPEASWPVDSSTYDSKDGEYLGPKYPFGTYSFPPRVLTRDERGQTSPWYDFVFALARRYDGNTADPQAPQKKLPRVDAWSCVEEPDVKSFWYGTSRDYFGGVGGDPAVGTLPSFFRAVKAGNPSATVLGGGLTSHQVGFYMAHELARAHGNSYDAAVRAYGTRYFNSNWPMQRVFATNVPNAQLFTQMENDRENIRARRLIDAMFSGSAPSYYDVIAIHSYDNWEMLGDLLAFHRDRSPSAKPVWITELGFADTPPPGASTAVSEPDQAMWLVKKITVALSEGVQHVSYAPLLALPGFAEIYPSASTERLARRSLQLLGRTLSETSGYHFARDFESDGTRFFVFDHLDGRSHVAIAWRERGSTAQDAKALLGIADGSTLRVLDHLERLVSTGVTSLTFGAEPLLIEWGPAVVDQDRDGFPQGVDCDDRSATVNPAMSEGGADPKDNDCNPVTK